MCPGFTFRFGMPFTFSLSCRISCAAGDAQVVTVCPERPHAEDFGVKGSPRRFFKQPAPAGLRITTPPALDADDGLFLATLAGFGEKEESTRAVRKLEREARSWQCPLPLTMAADKRMLTGPGGALTFRRILGTKGMWPQPCTQCHLVILGLVGVRGGAT